MADVPPELYKKLTSLRNLTQAIQEVRGHFNREADLKKDNNIVPLMRAGNQAPKAPVSASAGPLQYLGRKATQAGKIVHMMGMKGSAAPHYEVTVDAHKMGKVPHVSIAQVGANGSAIARHPQMFSNVEDAVKVVNNHHKTGSW